jgi:NADH-quinone oxidoreductase subunit M
VPVLSLIVFLPVLGALAVALLPRAGARFARWLALGFSLAALALSFLLFILYDRTAAGFQFQDRLTWISADAVGFDVQYYVGVDGLSLPLVILTTFLSVVAVLISWSIELRPKEYFAWLLVLETAVLGVFTALDFLLFFLFWEMELVPMFLLISIWGTGRREYSAMKFLVYTITGSAFMLVGILVLGFTAQTFDIPALMRADIQSALIPVQVVFFFIFFAFAVKLPVFPFHTWLPDAHTDAPTAVSVILAGVLLKMGGYGMLRTVTILPDVAMQYGTLLAIFAAINIIYGAIVTIRQQDLKRLIAYSSVSHMGFVLLGIGALTPVSLTGASLQLFTHGLITGLLFVMVGLVYDRAHTRDIGQLSGLAHVTPIIATVFVFAGLASLGLPALAGFVAEVTVFLGSFRTQPVPTMLGVVGILLTAGYILWMIQRVFFGPANPRWLHLQDARELWELLPLVGLVALIISIGIYPPILTDILFVGVRTIVQRLG